MPISKDKVLKSVQRGVITVTGTAIQTATISPVDISKSTLDLLGLTNPANYKADISLGKLSFVNSNTVQIEKNATSTVTFEYTYQVTEFY